MLSAAQDASQPHKKSCSWGQLNVSSMNVANKTPKAKSEMS